MCRKGKQSSAAATNSNGFAEEVASFNQVKPHREENYTL